MKIIDRLLKIDLPPAQSAFLWGPRKTGKTTYLKKEFPKSLVYDFLKTDLFIELSKHDPISQNRISAAVLGYLTACPFTHNALKNGRIKRVRSANVRSKKD